MTTRTPPAVHQPIACQHCNGESGHPPIPGEGVAVCTPCCYRLGRYAAEVHASRRLLDSAAIARRLAALRGGEA